MSMKSAAHFQVCTSSRMSHLLYTSETHLWPNESGPHQKCYTSVSFDGTWYTSKRMDYPQHKEFLFPYQLLSCVYVLLMFDTWQTLCNIYPLSTPFIDPNHQWNKMEDSQSTAHCQQQISGSLQRKQANPNCFNSSLNATSISVFFLKCISCQPISGEVSLISDFSRIV